MSEFLGQQVAGQELADSPWSPGLTDRSPRLAREQALELVRRLYRAWLKATLNPEESGVLPGMTRDELMSLVDRARGRDSQRGDEEASRVLFELNAAEPAP
jgi:hypothetical protein